MEISKGWTEIRSPPTNDAIPWRGRRRSRTFGGKPQGRMRAPRVAINTRLHQRDAGGRKAESQLGWLGNGGDCC